ncbi:MAG: DUF2231 domain-containing protein [Dehalococcoidia bacterium]
MNIAGLPAHPLLVHLAVVLVPIAALAFVLVMWRGSWRRAYGGLIAAAAAVGAAGALLAAQSGESLEHTLRATQGIRRELGEHPEQGDAAEFLALIFGLVAVALWAIDRWGARWSLPAWTPVLVYAAGVLAAAGSTGAMVVAGDSGARLVWETLGTFVTPR